MENPLKSMFTSTRKCYEFREGSILINIFNQTFTKHTRVIHYLNIKFRTNSTSQNANCDISIVSPELQDPPDGKSKHLSNLEAISCSENSSMEDLANDFVQGT